MIKAEYQHMEKKDPVYPYLGIFENRHVVLFTGPEEGVSLTGGRNVDSGTSSTTWSECLFDQLNGSITLSNK